MTALTEADISARLEALESKAALLDALMTNGLQDTLTGHGFQQFGGNAGRLNNNGIQILSNTNSNALWFVPPANGFFIAAPPTTSYSSIYGNNLNGALRADMTMEANSASVANAKLGVNTYSANDADAYIRADTTGYTAWVKPYVSPNPSGYSIVYISGQLGLNAVTADQATLANGSLWYRSDLNKIRARINAVTENLATESYVTGAVPAGGVPAITLSTAAAAGSAATFVRTDGTVIAFDATAPVTQANADVAAVGVAAVAARRDHKHGMPNNLAATRGTWKVFYSDGTGVFTELPLGAANTVLTSGGAAVAPTFAAAAAGGTVKTEQMITPYSWCSLGVQLAAMAAAAPASITWPTANLAIYVPFTLDESTTFTKAFWYNGATVSGNVDIGIYNEAGARQVSMGSTAQAGVNIAQEVNIAGTTLAAGRYYMALACNNVTATFARTTLAGAVATAVQTLGVAQQATAFVLPATATLASPANNYIPYFGFSIRTLVV